MNKLFEYCVIYHPLQTKDEKAANVMASREIPEEYLDKLDHVEIAVRPF